jgi:peptidoglycan/LPS O-acetylase OafA/YrhL
VAAFSRLSVLIFAPNFVAGVVAFTLPRVPRIKSFLWPVFIFGLILAFTLRPTRTTGWAACLVLGTLIPSFGELTTSWLRIVSKRIATYSYGIYLSHQFSIWIALGLLGSQSPWLRIPILIGLLVLLPIPLYHWVEKPMIQIGNKLATDSTREQSMSAGAAVVA